MTGKLKTQQLKVDPRELQLLTKNARRMSQRQFMQLVENIKRDGVLTSLPLVHRHGPEDKLVVLSGNHRTKAAIAAGFTEIDVLEVLGDDLDAERLLAIQLSHNAIAGEDDENILRELYDSLGVMEKLYSGLTDEDFGGVSALDLSKLAIGTVSYETVSLMFLPEDRETFVNAMENLGRGAAKTVRYVGRLEDFVQFEAAIVAVQDQLGIHNQALALLAMSELALERLEQLEIGNADEEADAQSAVDEEGTATTGTEAGEPENQSGEDGAPEAKRRGRGKRAASDGGDPKPRRRQARSEPV